MFSRPAFGTEKEHTALLRKILFACSVIFAAICLVFMLFSSHEQSRAMSGELLNQAGTNTLLTNEQTSFLDKIFEYFGGVSYLFPLIIIYITYKLVYKRLSWRDIDFFVIGTFIVGFNFLVLGLCSLLSVLFVAGQTGAGGMLGDFLTITLFHRLPAPIAMAIPLILTFCGLFLFTHKTPIWYCEAIGSFICSCIPFFDKEDEDNPSTVEVQEEKFDDDGIKITKSVKKTQSEERAKSDDKANNVAHDIEPSFGDESVNLRANDDKSVLADKAEAKTQASYEPPRFYNGPSDKANENKRRTQVSQEPLFKPQQKIEPMFSSDFGNLPNSNFEHADKNNFAQDNFAPQDQAYGGIDHNQIYNHDSFNEDGADNINQDNRPSTYIQTSGKVFSDSNNYNEDREQKNTIIHTSKQSVNSPSFNDDGATKTIVTRFEEKKEELNGDPVENKGPATIVTRYVAGAANLPPTEVVGNPNNRKSAVSTVITRTPEVKAVFNSQDVQMYEKDEALGGSFTHQEEDEPFENSAFIPQYEEEKENIISFNDVNENNHTIEVDKLSDAFVPTDIGTPSPLDKEPVALISEKDLNYNVYSQGTRGVLPRDDNANLEVNRELYASPVADKIYDEPVKTNYEERNEPSFGDDYESSRLIKNDEDSFNYDNHRDGFEVDPQEGSKSVDAFGDLSVKPEENPLTVFPTQKYSCATQTVPNFEYSDWRPAFSLLKLSDTKVMMDEETVQNEIRLINKFMHDFRIKAHVEHYLSGPVVTQYDLSLEPGVKSSTIRGVQMDLTRNLLVKSVRILDVVPGTPYVGLELPNPKRQLITLGDVVTKDEFIHTKASLPICLGVNVVGKPVVADLAQAPHLLICGTTGSGKSAGVNSMILSLLLTCSPAELRLILIDPKQVEFSLYAGLPHLITPIITETEPALAALDWLVSEMERRYTLIRNMCVHTVDECNTIIREAEAAGQVVYDKSWTADMGGTPPILKPLPKIVLIIDEFADLIATSSGNKKGSRNLETLLRRITAKARAAGIHLIMATQTPRAEVVTGVIKANIPSRIAYTVQSSTDSRVILDEPGAENLLGNGDMLINYQKLEGSKTFRAHGPFACNDDVKNVVKSWIDYAGDPEYIEGVTDYDDESEDEPRQEDIPGQTPGIDKIFDQVAQYAREYYSQKQKSPPISDIQVNFNVGYARAKRLKMQLIREGVVED